MPKQRKSGKQRLEIEVDYHKAVQVAKAAIEMKERGMFPFTPEKLPTLFPDAHIPSEIKQAGEKTTLAYIIHEVSLDSMRQSQQAYSAMRTLALRVGPDGLFHLHELSEEQLFEILIPFFGTPKEPEKFMSQPIKTLRENSRKLAEDYCGDPLRLNAMYGSMSSSVSTHESIRITLENIASFYQFGIPKAALVMKNAVREKIWNFPEHKIPIKVDRHVKRISLGTGIIDAEKYAETRDDWEKEDLPTALKAAKEQAIRIGYFSEQDFQERKVRVVRADRFVRKLTDTFQEVTTRHRISAIELDDALWAIGSHCCRRNDKAYCLGNCEISCQVRYPSDNNAVWFFVDVDKRKNHKNLFSSH